MSVRSLFYKAGLLRQVQLRTPVISIGNLTFGGTGKTPVAQLILDHFSKTNKKVVVVSRNYKAQTKKPVRVDLEQKNAAFLFGDEPCLIAKSYSHVPVYVGPRKWETASLAEKLESPDLLLIDDGFQHHALKRDLDIVLLDATAPFSEYRLFPLGRARETKKALDRAHVILITKCNLVSTEKIEQLKKFIKSYSQADVKIFNIEFKTEVDLSQVEGDEVLAFAGVGKPATFKKVLENLLVPKKVYFMGFGDHHPYSNKDVQNINNILRLKKIKTIITTEKDAIKLKDFTFEGTFVTADLKTRIQESSGEFYAVLDQVLHSNH